MKKFKKVSFISFLAIIASYIFISSSGAGNYHFGADLICSDCHTMHSSMEHNYAGGSGAEQGISSFPWFTTPSAYLLKNETSLQTCMMCHDQLSGVPDVIGTDVNGGTERAAGQFETVGSSWNGHNLSADPGSLCTRCHFGGNFGTASVTCTDCHNPHGAPSDEPERYRNLQWASDPGGEPEIRAYVNPSATGLQKYKRENVAYTAPTTQGASWREVTNICLDCHHTLSGTYTGTMGNWIRHPVTDSERGYWQPINRTGANTDPVYWEDGTGSAFSIGRVPFLVSGATTFAEASLVAQDNEVFCLSCHKAHGSDNSFGTVWNYGGGAPGEKTAGCNQCHNKLNETP